MPGTNDERLGIFQCLAANESARESQRASCGGKLLKWPKCLKNCIVYSIQYIVHSIYTTYFGPWCSIPNQGVLILLADWEVIGDCKGWEALVGKRLSCRVDDFPTVHAIKVPSIPKLNLCVAYVPHIYTIICHLDIRCIYCISNDM